MTDLSARLEAARRTAGAGDSLEALRDALHVELEEAGVESPTRPATTKLTHDQVDVIVDFLGGFETRRDVIEWQQRLVIQSLGQLEDAWYTRVAADAPTVAALLGRPWGPTEEMDDRMAWTIRRGMIAKDLLPAFHAAHRTFRWAAVERVDHLDDEADGDGPGEIDPRRQAYPLMRPAFGELAGQQRRVLASLLDGFDSEDELLLWTVQVIGGTYAELEAATAEAPYFEAPLKARLLNSVDGPRDRFVRESWAAEYLLPAFNRAAAQLGERAQEVTAGETVTRETGTGSIS